MKTFTPQDIEEFVIYWRKRPFGELCQDDPGILITALMNSTDIITYLQQREKTLIGVLDEFINYDGPCDHACEDGFVLGRARTALSGDN